MEQRISLRLILQRYKSGMAAKDYNVLIGELSDPKITSTAIIRVLKGLKDCVTSLDKTYEYLIGTILKLDWPYREPILVLEYQTFILNLVSAHTYYLKSVLKSFVGKFRPDVVGKEVPDEQRAKDGQAFINVHSVLQSIIKIVPMAPSILVPILVEKYPYVAHSSYQHESYVRNLLHIPKYLPQFRRKILALIIEKMLELDTRSPRQDIIDALDEDDEEEDNMSVDGNDEEMFKMDDSADKTQSKTEKTTTQEIDLPEANTLDVLMNIMLQNINNICGLGNNFNWEVTKNLYKEFLSIFDEVILPTHSSSHVQYLMFYLCSFRPALSDGFIDYLWKKVKDPNTQPVFRQAAVAYMSGFLSRGMFVSLPTAMVAMEHMANWVHTYINNSIEVSADIVHHGPFYSVCQGLFYTYIFRHKELLQTKQGYQLSQNLNFQSIVTSRLNPLKICLPVIVKTFSAVTRQHQIAFCDSIIEHNNRMRLQVTTLETAQISLKMSRTNPLDSFFPFDPYVLPKSKHLIEPLFREYSGIPIEDDNKDSEDEDDFLVNEAGQSTSVSKSPAEMLLFGTSPHF